MDRGKEGCTGPTWGECLFYHSKSGRSIKNITQNSDIVHQKQNKICSYQCSPRYKYTKYITEATTQPELHWGNLQYSPQPTDGFDRDASW